ncbi:YtzH-like family protein [Halalkalibacterium halodurans]|jgi:hypothetical protein|uniref:BH3262 protein n=2 Tax=Halalkalibacterium halodurans TaxID=86665 RepID=Q9K7U7_HALH5|nr:YtzH-like family protein [Halalkalibacterium halodurans]MDY7223794.1 YtzH-like family protein [Halalkalibacterium halodurans]MDY7243015.1 YtzH-like family protein [Halalkalibacterium halodurans]MED3645970.1 YtzH-like family protein [Halalkalibacterium halodurans]MED4079986.1 YtzH-like family protein [Halalkalibacterium halodurans]MED4084442.1 YtzH-like family protein [Halalkalibacterium halodurans]
MLNNTHKLGLLKDLLQGQDADQYMTLDQARQIDELTLAMMNDPNLSADVQATLESIQSKLEHNTSPFLASDVEQWLSELDHQ